MRLGSIGLAALLTASPALAQGPVAFGPDLAAQGWRTMTLPGKAATAYSAEGAGTLRIASDRSVSVIWRPLPRDFADAGSAAWRWRVDAGVPPSDLGTRGGDDRAIALYFFFADDASAVDRPPTSLRAAMRQGRALIYVWGGDAPAGSLIASPSMRGFVANWAVSYLALSAILIASASGWKRSRNVSQI